VLEVTKAIDAIRVNTAPEKDKVQVSSEMKEFLADKMKYFNGVPANTLKLLRKGRNWGKKKKYVSKLTMPTLKIDPKYPTSNTAKIRSSNDKTIGATDKMKMDIEAVGKGQ